MIRKTSHKFVIDQKNIKSPFVLIDIPEFGETKGTEEQMNSRTDEQTNSRTVEQRNSGTAEQQNGRSVDQ